MTLTPTHPHRPTHSAPPLVLLSCNCGSAPTLLYQFLKSHHVPNYLSIPLYKGDKARRWASPYPDLSSYIATQSGYAIIVDVSTLNLPNSKPRWADIGKHSGRATIIAEEIVASIFPSSPSPNR